MQVKTKIQIQRKIQRQIQRQKRYQSKGGSNNCAGGHIRFDKRMYTTFLKQTRFLDFKSDCQNCKSSNVAKIWMETTCSRSFIAFCGGKQWKLASAFTFLWRNPLIGFHSIKFHFEFCVKSFKHSYNNLTIKTKYSLLEEANFHFIKSTKLSLSQEKCKNFHWKMLHHSLSEQIKQLSLAQKKRNNFF